MFIFMKKPYQGAQTTIYLATDEKIKSTSGEYFKWVVKVQSSSHNLILIDDKLAWEKFSDVDMMLWREWEWLRESDNFRKQVKQSD